jgi:hypothetical protein
LGFHWVHRGAQHLNGIAYMEALIRPMSWDHRPTLTWPRQISLGGEPADVVEIVAANSEWLAASNVATPLIDAEPGAILTGPMRGKARGFAN